MHIFYLAFAHLTNCALKVNTCARGAGVFVDKPRDGRQTGAAVLELPSRTSPATPSD